MNTLQLEHISIDSNNNKNVNKIHNKNKDERPYIKIYIANKQFSCLLDSGATASTVNACGMIYLQELGYRAIKINSIESTMANGSKGLIRKYFSVPIIFNDKMALIKFHVLEKAPCKFLLGTDFIKTFELQMNFKENEWHIKSEMNRNKMVEPNSIIDSESLNKIEKQKLEKVINKFNLLCTGTLGKTNIMEHRIETGNAEPVFKRPYPVSPPLEERMSRELDRMIKLDVVEKSNSPWCQPIVLTKKKNGKDRLCIDCRELNRVTTKSKYALPRIEQILSRLGKAKYITSIDLQDAYWQIPLQKDSRSKTAFIIPGRGMWQFKVVPFGLTTSAQAMQRLMDSLFNEQGEFIYIDDIIIVSETFEEHIAALKRVFNKLKKANLTINIEKCSFCRPSLKYLGYIVDKHGLRTDPDKIACIADYQLPKTLKELRRFIGMTSYYRRFIDKFANIIAPLHDLTKKRTRTIKWTAPAVEAFENLKSAMIQAPVLVTPDFNKKFIIQCDASDKAVGAVLVQKDEEGEDKPISFVSRKLRGAEINYTTTEKECLAIVFAIEKFKQYVEGLQFEIITDHSALIWLLKQKDLRGRLARWVLMLQQFDFEVKHIKGKNNVVPDAISRFPTEEITLIQFDSSDCDEWYERLKEKIEKWPNKYENYKIKDGKIFIKLNKKQQNTECTYRLVVPPSKRELVIKECHDNPKAAHLGSFKTAKRILQRYYWPGIVRDVKEYVKKMSYLFTI